VNKRLQAEDIKQFINAIFKGQGQLLKEELYEYSILSFKIPL